MSRINISLRRDRVSVGAAAAALGADRIRDAIAARGAANIVVATGASQFEMLNALVEAPAIAWERVTAFHLAEYIGLPITHPSSFRASLWERFERRLPRPLRAFHYIVGEGDPAAECARLERLLGRHPIDVCFAGIGENAHLAFNEAPADFRAERACRIVELGRASREQQYGEGWFPTVQAVPERAITMSIRQIFAARTLVVTATGPRKAAAVKRTVEGAVRNSVPASVLQRHPDAHLFLDEESAALLEDGRRSDLGVRVGRRAVERGRRLLLQGLK